MIVFDTTYKYNNKTMTSCILITFIITLISSSVLCKIENVKCVYIHQYIDLPLPQINDCKHKSICNTTFKIYYLRLKPYDDGIIRNLFEDILKSCCGNCFKRNNKSLIRSKISRANNYHKEPSRVKTADFLYPVAASSSETVYGRYFIPLYELQGAFYVTSKQAFTLMQLLMACVELWPLLTACLMMAILSGFVAWILETWANKNEFPRAFFSGWFEGFWWAFISMTTVGYGDKSPKSIAARLFSTAWILTGIITFGILTSSLTTTILKASTPEAPNMVGSKIGAMRKRIYDGNVIAQNGGYLQENEYGNKSDISEFFYLLHSLTSKTSDGFLLDKNTFWKMRVYSNMLLNNRTKLERDELRFKTEMKIAAEEKVYLKKLVTFFLNKTIQTFMPHVGEKLYYGVLVNHYEHYEFFKDALMDNKMVFQRVMSANLFANYSRKEITHSRINIHLLFGSKYIMIAVGTIFGIILSFGIIFEAIRNKRGKMYQYDVELGEKVKQKRTPITSNTDDSM